MSRTGWVARMSVPNNSWLDEAACHGHDPELWFPGRESKFHGPADARKAIEICQSCPVSAECLILAIGITSEHPLYGVWAGIHSKQIHKLAGRRSRRHARRVIPDSNK